MNKSNDNTQDIPVFMAYGNIYTYVTKDGVYFSDGESNIHLPQSAINSVVRAINDYLKLNGYNPSE